MAEMNFYEVYYTKNCTVGYYATSIDRAIEMFKAGVKPDWDEKPGAINNVAADIQDDPARVGW